MEWAYLESGKASAEDNMETDCRLLNGLASADKALLRFYDWDGNSATYGHFVNPLDFLDLDRASKHHLQMARRPTGGGIVFHLCDLAFSILIPQGHPSFSTNTLDNYAFVNRAVAKAVGYFLGNSEVPILLPHEPSPLDQASRSFCMAKPTIYDVMLDGRKVGGGAQRRTKHGLLHQGTIVLAMPSEEFLKDVLLPNTQVLEAMRKNSHFLLGDTYTEQTLNEARKELRHLLWRAVS